MLKQPIHFFGIYQHCIPFLPQPVLDRDKSRYCSHKTVRCLSNDHCVSTFKAGLTLVPALACLPCFCSLHRLKCVGYVISCMGLNSSVALWQVAELTKCFSALPSHYIQKVPNLRELGEALFLGHKGPVFSLASLKSVGGRKSLSGLKRDSSLPRSWSRSCLLWGSLSILKQLHIRRSVDPCRWLMSMACDLWTNTQMCKPMLLILPLEIVVGGAVD